MLSPASRKRKRANSEAGSAKLSVASGRARSDAPAPQLKFTWPCAKCKLLVEGATASALSKTMLIYTTVTRGATL